MGLSPMSTIPDGQYTSTIYGWIKESKYDDVVSALEVCFDHFLFLLLLRLAFFSSYFFFLDFSVNLHFLLSSLTSFLVSGLSSARAGFRLFMFLAPCGRERGQQSRFKLAGLLLLPAGEVRPRGSHLREAFEALSKHGGLRLLLRPVFV